MKKLALMILVVFAAFSCAKDPSGDVPGKKGVSVRFSIPDFAQVNTRATDESGIKDVWVLQYKEGSLITGSVQILRVTDGVNFTMANQLIDLVDMPAASNKADSLSNFVCFLANLETVGVTQAQIESLTTVAALNAFKLDIDQTTTGTVLPMRGFYYGGISTQATNQLNVALERAVAKINFTYNADNFKAGGKLTKFTLVSIKLKQTPKQFTITKNAYQPALPVGSVNGLLPQGFTPYPAGVAADIMMDINENVATTATGFVAYVAENARGSFEGVTDNKMKNPVASAITGFSAQADYCTYIELVGEYTDDTSIKWATYKIYLGGNATGDMNIIANATYNVTTYIYGANIADTRITTNDIFNESSLVNLKKPANSYIVNANGASQTFTVPLSQVINGWNVINATINAANAASRVDVADLFSNESNWDAEILWKTWQGDNVTAVPTGAALKKYMTVTVPASVANGNNAVLALYDRRSGSATEGKVIWSWHLWFTDYEPSTSGGTAVNGQMHQYISNAFKPGGVFNGKFIMDRNLGATITGTDDIATMMTTPATATPANGLKTYGLLYQWGRKDPFTSTVDAGTTTSPLITTSLAIYDKNNAQLTEFKDGTLGAVGQGVNSLTTTVIAAISPNPSNVMLAAQNPLTFLANGGDWTGGATGVADFWGGTGVTKGAFDPCPAGYRVPKGGTSPTDNVWAGFNGQPLTETIVNYGEGPVFTWYYQGTTTLSPANGRTTGRLFSDGTTTAWYSASGHRNPSSGALNLVGSNGYYWSSSVTSSNGYYLALSNALTYPAYNGSGRAAGFPVRCVQE